jgi:RNA polymerase sigma factor (TIGR02999 family)
LNKQELDCGPPEHGEAPEYLVPLLYQELRRLAARCLRRERPNHTLQPTALVNEAYLRLAAQSRPAWNDRAEFLAVASHLMREILIDYARTRNRAKRGGGLAPICIEDAGELAAAPEVELMALDEALHALERIDTQQRQIVELRYFGGLSIEETARVLGVSAATVKRDWRMAKAWLHRELSPHAAHDC